VDVVSVLKLLNEAVAIELAWKADRVHIVCIGLRHDNMDAGHLRKLITSRDCAHGFISDLQRFPKSA
jgi:hypothetical protein